MIHSKDKVTEKAKKKKGKMGFFKAGYPGSDSFQPLDVLKAIHPERLLFHRQR